MTEQKELLRALCVLLGWFYDKTQDAPGPRLLTRFEEQVESLCAREAGFEVAWPKLRRELALEQMHAEWADSDRGDLEAGTRQERSFDGNRQRLVAAGQSHWIRWMLFRTIAHHLRDAHDLMLVDQLKRIRDDRRGSRPQEPDQDEPLPSDEAATRTPYEDVMDWLDLPADNPLRKTPEQHLDYPYPDVLGLRSHREEWKALHEQFIRATKPYLESNPPKLPDDTYRSERWPWWQQLSTAHPITPMWEYTFKRACCLDRWGSGDTREALIREKIAEVEEELRGVDPPMRLPPPPPPDEQMELEAYELALAAERGEEAFREAKRTIAKRRKLRDEIDESERRNTNPPTAMRPPVEDRHSDPDSHSAQGSGPPSSTIEPGRLDDYIQWRRCKGELACRVQREDMPWCILAPEKDQEAFGIAEPGKPGGAAEDSMGSERTDVNGGKGAGGTSPDKERGVIIETGNRAMFFVHGRLTGELSQGAHPLAELRGMARGLRGHRPTVVLVAVDETWLEFRLLDQLTADKQRIDIFLRLSFKITRPQNFFLNLMKSRERYEEAELRRAIFLPLKSCVDEFVRGQDAHVLAAVSDPTRQALLLAIKGNCRTLLERIGLDIVAVNLFLSEADMVEESRRGAEQQCEPLRDDGEQDAHGRRIDVWSRVAEDMIRHELLDKRHELHELDSLEQLALGYRRLGALRDEEWRDFQRGVDWKHLQQEWEDCARSREHADRLNEEERDHRAETAHRQRRTILEKLDETMAHELEFLRSEQSDSIDLLKLDLGCRAIEEQLGEDRVQEEARRKLELLIFGAQLQLQINDEKRGGELKFDGRIAMLRRALETQQLKYEAGVVALLAEVTLAARDRVEAENLVNEIKVRDETQTLDRQSVLAATELEFALEKRKAMSEEAARDVDRRRREALQRLDVLEDRSAAVKKTGLREATVHTSVEHGQRETVCPICNCSIGVIQRRCPSCGNRLT